VEQRIVECLKHPKAVAWGETGLDFHFNHSEPEKQKEVFAMQVLKAVEVKKPIIVHSRSAEDATFKILKENMPQDWKVHVHCFNESASHAKRLLSDFPNLYIGFTGAITFNSAQAVRDVIKNVVPIERMLLETDGPYMAPAPHQKGTIAHMGHIPLIASKVADLKQLDIDVVYKTIRENTRQMYGI